MHNYIENHLNPNEKLIHFCKPHWIIYATPMSWFVAGVLMLFLGNQFAPLEFYVIMDMPFYKLFTMVAFLFSIITLLVSYLVYWGTDFAKFC